VNYLFPLYLEPEDRHGERDQGELGDLLEASQRRTNLAAGFISAVEKKCALAYGEGKARGELSKNFGPEDVVGYVYAVLHSATYRELFSEFLKREFPRIPVIGPVSLFRALVRAGLKLMDVHLMNAELKPSATFPIKGSGVVEEVRYAEPTPGTTSGKVWINNTQFFSGVTPEVWQHRIGSYQVSKQWLQDRKGRQLEFDDLNQYLNILAACERGMELVDEIDDAVTAAGGWSKLLRKTM
jgi:hypothetical protein